MITNADGDIVPGQVTPSMISQDSNSPENFGYALVTTDTGTPAWGKVGNVGIADGAVTSFKIGQHAVKSFNVSENAITNPKISDGAVTPEKTSGVIGVIPVGGQNATEYGAMWIE